MTLWQRRDESRSKTFQQGEAARAPQGWKLILPRALSHGPFLCSWSWPWHHGSPIPGSCTVTLQSLQELPYTLFIPLHEGGWILAPPHGFPAVSSSKECLINEIVALHQVNTS